MNILGMYAWLIKKLNTGQVAPVGHKKLFVPLILFIFNQLLVFYATQLPLPLLSQKKQILVGVSKLRGNLLNNKYRQFL